MESFGRPDKADRPDKPAGLDKADKPAGSDRPDKAAEVAKPPKKVVARRLPGYRDWVKTYFRNPRKSRLKFHVHMDYTSY